MKRKKTKIRLRLLAFFSAMLLLSFTLIGIIFNVAVRQYIQSSAVSQLDKTYDNMLEFIDGADNFIIRRPDGSTEFAPPNGWFGVPARQNSFRINANVFVVDIKYDLPFIQDISDETLGITQKLKDTNTDLLALQHLLIKTDNGAFYISAHPMPENTMNGNTMNGNNYFIVYADVTGLLSFATTINTFLIILVFVMFVLTVFFAFFLSNTITRPIKKLSVFASKIGRGDFTPNDYAFNDEEFENLNTVLNNSARQLSIYDSEQKAFFQNASHELRTPLMSIQCQAEGLSLGYMEPKAASETILQETQRLTKLVTDLLYISKIDNITSVYTTEKTDLLEIIRASARRQEMIADKAGKCIIFDFKESILEYECVSELISRAVDNLISNAIRYAVSEIMLSCKREAAKIVIQVSDDGAGINVESMPHVFERFYKGSDGNHGIGLSLVKAIAEQHNGRASAENSKKGGAVFTITLPCAAWR